MLLLNPSVFQGPLHSHKNYLTFKVSAWKRFFLSLIQKFKKYTLPVFASVIKEEIILFFETSASHIPTTAKFYLTFGGLEQSICFSFYSRTVTVLERWLLWLGSRCVLSPPAVGSPAPLGGSTLEEGLLSSSLRRSEAVGLLVSELLWGDGSIPYIPLPGAGQPPSAEMRCWPLLQEPGHGAGPPRRAPARRQRRVAAQRGSRRLPERGARGGLWSSSPGTAQKRQIIICRGALRDIS